MTSVNLKFRASAIAEKEGTLFFQIIHKRVVRQIGTDYRIFPWEWDETKGALIEPGLNYARHVELDTINRQLQLDISKLNETILYLEAQKDEYTAGDVVSSFTAFRSGSPLVFAYIADYIVRLKRLGRLSTANNTRSTLNSFMSFRENKDLSFAMLTAEMIELYEAYLKARGNTRNTTSFYLRTLRSAYCRAVEEGLADDANLFKNVYTGVDKTSKRAISQKEMKRIRDLNLFDHQPLMLARDLFLFSFYTRGMSFVDLAYLRKKDVQDGTIVYRRSKTTQELYVQWETQMQEIVDRYPNDTQYLLPIITQEDGTERRQYKNALMLINQKLKEIGKLANVSHPISMYTARHTWASMARSMNVPLSVISEGLGHDNDKNTQIYLASIKTQEVDKANRRIIARMLDDKE